MIILLFYYIYCFTILDLIKFLSPFQIDAQCLASISIGKNDALHSEGLSCRSFYGQDSRKCTYITIRKFSSGKSLQAVVCHEGKTIKQEPKHECNSPR